jgi:hypothetical protein
VKLERLVVEARTYRPNQSRGGHKYLLQIMFGRHMFRMYLRNRLTNVCILRRISAVTSNYSHSYKSTDCTHKLQFLILVSFRIDADSRTSHSLRNDPQPSVFSHSPLHCLRTALPKYQKSDDALIYFPFNLRSLLLFY